MQPAGRVQHDHVIALQAADGHGALGDGNRLLAGHDGQGGHTGLLAQDAQLFLRRRTMHVQRGHQHLLLVALGEAARQLAGGGGLARALQADHKDRHRGGGVQVDWFRLRAQHLDQLVMDDLHHHLARRDRAQHFLADGLLAGLGNEILHHRQGDIGLQQRHAHFAHDLLDVALGEGAAPLQSLEHIAELAGQAVEQGLYPVAVGSV